jgi:hypothetical protein
MTDTHMRAPMCQYIRAQYHINGQKTPLICPYTRRNHRQRRG